MGSATCVDQRPVRSPVEVTADINYRKHRGDINYQHRWQAPVTSSQHQTPLPTANNNGPHNPLPTANNNGPHNPLSPQTTTDPVPRYHRKHRVIPHLVTHRKHRVTHAPTAAIATTMALHQPHGISCSCPPCAYIYLCRQHGSYMQPCIDIPKLSQGVSRGDCSANGQIKCKRTQR
jgi:hypothetical protein